MRKSKKRLNRRIAQIYPYGFDIIIKIINKKADNLVGVRKTAHARYDTEDVVVDGVDIYGSDAV